MTKTQYKALIVAQDIIREVFAQLDDNEISNDLFRIYRQISFAMNKCYLKNRGSEDE